MTAWPPISEVWSHVWSPDTVSRNLFTWRTNLKLPNFIPIYLRWWSLRLFEDCHPNKKKNKMIWD